MSATITRPRNDRIISNHVKIELLDTDGGSTTMILNGNRRTTDIAKNVVKRLDEMSDIGNKVAFLVPSGEGRAMFTAWRIHSDGEFNLHRI